MAALRARPRRRSEEAISAALPGDGELQAEEPNRRIAPVGEVECTEERGEHFAYFVCRIGSTRLPFDQFFDHTIDGFFVVHHGKDILLDMK